MLSNATPPLREYEHVAFSSVVTVSVEVLLVTVPVGEWESTTGAEPSVMVSSAEPLAEGVLPSERVTFTRMVLLAIPSLRAVRLMLKRKLALGTRTPWVTLYQETQPSPVEFGVTDEAL